MPTLDSIIFLTNKMSGLTSPFFLEGDAISTSLTFFEISKSLDNYQC